MANLNKNDIVLVMLGSKFVDNFKIPVDSNYLYTNCYDTYFIKPGIVINPYDFGEYASLVAIYNGEGIDKIPCVDFLEYRFSNCDLSKSDDSHVPEYILEKDFIFLVIEQSRNLTLIKDNLVMLGKHTEHAVKQIDDLINYNTSLIENVSELSCDEINTLRKALKL